MNSRVDSDKLALAAGVHKNEREYWFEKLSGDLVKTTFSYDYPPESKIHGRMNRETETFECPPGLVSLLMRLSKGSDIKLHMILAAGLFLLLNKYTGSEDILFGSPILKQDAGAGADFVNTVLVFRNPVYGNLTFKELLQQVRETIIGANKHQNYPMETLHHHLNMPMAGNESPLFDVVLLLENLHDKQYIRHVHYNIGIFFARTGDAVKGVLEYYSSLYRESTIKRIIRHYMHLLEQALQDLDGQISVIQPLSPGEKRQVLEEFNRVEMEYPEDGLLHRLFEEQAERTPHRIALVGAAFEMADSPCVAVSFDRLNRKADEMAHLLREKGIAPGAIVALMVEPSVEMLAGILAILKAGGAYLPINPDHPRKRVKYILQDSGAKILLSQLSELSELSGLGEDVEIVNLCELDKKYPAPLVHPGQPTHPTSSSHLSYVIYTSGTTGKPRGVMVEHRNVAAYLHAFYQEFDVGREDVVIQLAAYTFDVFVEEVFSILLRGGKIVIPTEMEMMALEKLPELIARHRVTIIDCTPLLLNEFNRRAGDRAGENLFQSVRTFISGGDVLKAEYVDNLVRAGKVYNTYGPTESTVCAAYYNYQPGDAGAPGAKYSSIPIGKPISNYSIYILDNYGSPVPIGVPGELCVSGPGVTRGYLNRPELTAERYNRSYKSYRAYNLFFNLYHTGDLARWLPDGNIEFLGRKDQQVKIRGFRIEPGEIENCLVNHGDIREAIVIDRKDSSGDRYLCAYVVLEHAAPGTENQLEEVLRDHLAKMLPDYMIPVYYVPLGKIPSTLNGKVDRRALPAPRFTAGTGYIAPVTSLEKTLAGMWAEVLDVDIDIIGLNSNFFKLGGHSLKATQVMVRIHKEFNVGISLGRMYEAPRLDQMAEVILQAEQSIYQSVQPIEKREYYDVSTAQAGHNIHYRFEKKQGPFNYVSSLEMDDLDRDALERAFETLVKRHESLRTTFLWVGDEVKQKVHPYNALGFEVKYIDLRRLRREKAIRDRVNLYLREAHNILFDFINGPLLDVKLLHLTDSKYFLVFSMHHVMSDGWSAGVMVEELRAIYGAYVQGQENPLPAMRIQFKDYVAWNRRMLNPDNRSRLRDFWHRRLSPPLPEVTLATRFADKATVGGRSNSYRVQMRREIQDFYKGLTQQEQELFFGVIARVKSERGSSYVFTVNGETLGALKQLAAGIDTGLFAVLAAGFNILFQRLTGENDIIIGFNSITRDHDDLENLIGFLLNTLLLRNNVDNRLPVEEFLMQTAQSVTAANDHRAYPFEQLLYDLDIPFHAVGTVFLNMLNFQQNPTAAIDDFTPRYYKKGGSPYFDIDYHINEYSNGISIACDFKRDLFKRDTIEFINREYVRVLRAIATDPGKKIMELPL